jgi:hypothetical protein
MQDVKALAAAGLLGITLVTQSAVASGPLGVWVKVQEVVYTPDAANPSHVQLRGAFMLYDGDRSAARPYPGYTPPALGYMYYRCPDGQAETCRQEWRDLEQNIAEPDTVCLGFGMDSLPTGTLRQPGTAADNPDPYPIQSGVSPAMLPCQVIAEYLAKAGGGAAGTGGSASSGGKDAGAGAPASTGGTGTGGRMATAGAGGAAAVGKGGTTAGRTGSDGAVDEPAERTAENQVSGCSTVQAGGAVSLFGFVAAGGALVLALKRRKRRTSRACAGDLVPHPELPRDPAHDMPKKFNSSSQK